MRSVGVFVGLLVCATIITAQSKPPLVQTAPFIPQRNADGAASDYITAVMPILEMIHNSYYFEEISMEALGGRAILGLYRKANVAPPELLVRDPDHYFNTLPEATFRDKLRRAREAVGDSPLIRGEFGVYRSMEAVFATLDPFSSFAGVDENIRSTADAGSGIGLFLEDRPQGGSYFVRTVALGSIAQKRGLKPGDELLEINQTAIKLDTPTSLVQIEIAKNLQSRAGVTLTIRTLTGEKKIVTLKNVIEPNESALLPFLTDGQTVVYGYRRREETEWDYWFDHKNGIAIFRLGIILSETPALVSNALQQMSEDGLKAVILDLRDCPSGTLESTADLAGLFLEERALIASIKYRTRQNLEDRDTRSEYRASASDKSRWLNVPLTVLIGPDTSGAAELVAAALQDHERAKIIGQRSRGKATIWGPNRSRTSRVNYSIKLSTGMFFRPSGKNLHRLSNHTASDDWGVRPDIEVVLPATMRRQIRAWWFEHDLRPVGSNEATRLDNPRNDPVLEAALRALRQQLQTQ